MRKATIIAKPCPVCGGSALALHYKADVYKGLPEVELILKPGDSIMVEGPPEIILENPEISALQGEK